MKVAQLCSTLRPHGLYNPWNSPGQNTGVGNLSLLQGIFPTQVLNPGLPHCRRILYELSHEGIPRILEWVAYPFSSGSSPPRNRRGVLLHCRQILHQLSHEGSPVQKCFCIGWEIYQITWKRYSNLHVQVLSAKCSDKSVCYGGQVHHFCLIVGVISC